MATPPTPEPATAMVLVEEDRPAVRRFALRRALVSSQLAVVVLLLAGAGIAQALGFGLLSGALTYAGFTAQGTRGLPSTNRSTTQTPSA